MSRAPPHPPPPPPPPLARSASTLYEAGTSSMIGFVSAFNSSSIGERFNTAFAEIEPKLRRRMKRNYNDKVRDPPPGDMQEKPTWTWYMNLIENDLSRIERSRTLKHLVRRCGIPPDLRGKVWMILSGAEHPHELAYADILSAATQAPVSDSSKQIDKDVHRTFKDKNLESEEGIEELRRVLLSYAWVNADIGYCQSMNFIAATFLLYLGEEDAFWLLKRTIEHILPPQYYTRGNMIGARVDQAVMSELLAIKLPHIYRHIETVGFPLGSIVTTWFMSLFVNELPLAATLRFFDALFLEGNKALFRFALALFKIHESEVLAASDFDELFLVLKHMCAETDADLLAEAAYDREWLGSLDMNRITDLRKKYFQLFWRQESSNKSAATSRATAEIRRPTFTFGVGATDGLLRQEDEPPPPPTLVPSHRPIAAYAVVPSPPPSPFPISVPLPTGSTMAFTISYDDEDDLDLDAYRPRLDAWAPIMPESYDNPDMRHILCL